MHDFVLPLNCENAKPKHGSWLTSRQRILVSAFLEPIINACILFFLCCDATKSSFFIVQQKSYCHLGFCWWWSHWFDPFSSSLALLWFPPLGHCMATESRYSAVWFWHSPTSQQWQSAKQQTVIAERIRVICMWIVRLMAFFGDNLHQKPNKLQAAQY